VTQGFSHTAIAVAPSVGVVPRVVGRDATNGAPCLGVALALGAAVWLLGAASALALLPG
jgi:hypothetical protein